MPTKPLTEKQKKFCNIYLKDFNGTKAYQETYKVKESVARANASRLLTNANVQAYLAKLIHKQEESAQITVFEIVEDLKLLKDRCMQEIEVRDKEGNPTGEWRFDSAGANRSLELLGKHLAMFTDKFEVKHDLADLLRKIEDESDRGLPKTGEPAE